MANITKMNIPECTFAESRFKRTQIEANVHYNIQQSWLQYGNDNKNMATVQN